MASHSNTLVYQALVIDIDEPSKSTRKRKTGNWSAGLFLFTLTRSHQDVSYCRTSTFFRAARTRLFMTIKSKNKALRPSPPPRPNATYLLLSTSSQHKEMLLRDRIRTPSTREAGENITIEPLYGDSRICS
jgi:hypothetical protein